MHDSRLEGRRLVYVSGNRLLNIIITEGCMFVQKSSLYATATPADEIKFESRYGAPYYQEHLKPKVIPNLILLICALLLFLFFIFW